MELDLTQVTVVLKKTKINTSILNQSVSLSLAEVLRRELIILGWVLYKTRTILLYDPSEHRLYRSHLVYEEDIKIEEGPNQQPDGKGGYTYNTAWDIKSLPKRNGKT